ncbi:hypothetical protein F2P79_009355 [Pimephales promelas]|nr:hypothetical protein F2P79_009355 [Pimephales promelas]
MCDSLLSGAGQKNETPDCAATVSSSHFYRSNKTKPFLSRRGVVGVPIGKRNILSQDNEKEEERARCRVLRQMKESNSGLEQHEDEGE